MTNIEKQLKLETKYSKKIVALAIEEHFNIEIDNGNYIDATSSLMENRDILVSILYNLYKDKRKAVESTPVSNAVGFEMGADNAVDAFKLGSVAIESVLHLINVERAIIGQTMHFIKHHSLPTELQKQLDLSMTLPPMVCEPLPHSSNSKGGYLLNPTSCMINHKGTDLQSADVYTVINKAQKVAWKIETRVLPSIEKYLTNEDVLKTVNYDIVIKSYAKLDKFYFAYNYDWRGRLYANGYDINPQGSQDKKAMLVYADGELLTPSGLTSLIRSIANAYGLDKRTNPEKEQWFEENKDILWSLLDDADEPLIMERQLWGYQDYLDNKTVHCPVDIDATASGLQFYSILSKDELTAELVNIKNIGDDVRADLYTLVANRLLEESEYPWTRKLVKKPIMIKYYSAGLITMANEIVSKDISIEVATDMMEELQSVLEEISPKAEMMMSEMLNLFHSQETTNYNWTMLDGFKVSQAVESKKLVQVKSMAGYTAKITVTNKEYNPHARGIAPNIIHSVDAYTLRRTILDSDFTTSTIHDSFGSHPNHTHKLFSNYKNILVEILNSNLYKDIIHEATGQYSQIIDGNLTATDILEAKYTLC